MLRLAQAAVLLVGILVMPAVLSANAPIILPAKRVVSAHTQLVVFVPGGKVPPEDYIALLNATQQSSKTNFITAIVRCGKLNLCNPLTSLNGEIAAAIAAAVQVNGGKAFAPTDIFVAGHSLGGVGARHYVDTNKNIPYAGLMLFGTQYNGDHEDYLGTLGYPENLESFRIPLLVLVGELDKLPISHAALLYKQYESMSPVDQAKKPVVVVPGMDHSQFCSPFEVSGDLKAEISNNDAIRLSSSVIASFIDAQNVLEKPDVRSSATLATQNVVNNWTKPILSAWIEAADMETSKWCVDGQKLILSYLPNSLQSKVRNINVLLRNSSASLEHGHTNVTVDPVSGDLDLTIVAHATYANNSFNPIKRFAPGYTGASDISCKMLSGDKVAKEAGLPKGMYWPSKTPNVTCENMNKKAVGVALSLLRKHWPSAVQRWTDQGRPIQLDKDHTTIAGPQWVFFSSLIFNQGETSTDKSIPVKISSSSLYSSTESLVFPGNYYCKFLSPAKAIEWIMTMGLTERFS